MYMEHPPYGSQAVRRRPLVASSLVLLWPPPSSTAAAAVGCGVTVPCSAGPARSRAAPGRHCAATASTAATTPAAGQFRYRRRRRAPPALLLLLTALALAWGPPPLFVPILAAQLTAASDLLLLSASQTLPRVPTSLALLLHISRVPLALPPAALALLVTPARRSAAAAASLQRPLPPPHPPPHRPLPPGGLRGGRLPIMSPPRCLAFARSAACCEAACGPWCRSCPQAAQGAVTDTAVPLP